MSITSLDVNEYHWYYAYSSALDVFHTLDVGAPIVELAVIFITVAYLCAFLDVAERPIFVMRTLNILMVGNASIVGITLW